MPPRHKKHKADTSSSLSSSSSSPALSLDADDLNYPPPSSLSSPITHDLAAVELCSSFLSIQEQLKSLTQGRYAEERPGAPVFEVRRNVGLGSIEVTRYIDICHDLQAATAEARQRVFDEIAKRTQDLLDLDKEIMTLEDGNDEESDGLALQIGQLHFMKRQHKKRIRELQNISEVEVKVRVDRACLRVEVVQEETARAVTEARMVPVKDSSIYVIGGEKWDQPSREVQRFDTKSNCWEASIPMISERFGCMSVVADGYLYAIGGVCAIEGQNDSRRACLVSVERFDQRCQRWEAVAPMLSPRSFAAVSVLGGKLYVAGGLSDSRHVLCSVVCFDLATKRWEDVVPLKQKRAYCAAVVLNGLFYVIGGLVLVNGKKRSTDTVERFDPAKKEWELMPPTTCTRNGCGVAVLNEQIYVVGGMNKSKVERFDPKSGSWTLVAPMVCKRNLCAAVVMDGWLYAIGGQDSDRVALSTVERYDYKTDTWKLVTPMPVGGFGHGVVIV
eukprot:gb/GEZN01006446.1/.p1 GENE.gb/GEZN01006446.1/~~gb/GEZN01006446.1/.p1  ORF type:complete len:501 (+),score=72.17 gb/GEZN01006446.1/:25-1527(+)